MSEEKKDSLDIIKIAESRIAEDRTKLEKLQLKLEELADNSDNDLMVYASIAEQITKISEALTKQTSQLIELAKIRQKTELTIQKEDGLSENDKLDLFDEFDSREATN